MTSFANEFRINNSYVGNKHPTYFIADIAANHDGELSRAKELIHMCAEAGASAVKFQHFSAETIVSSRGFEHLGKQISHQASWKKSVYQIYEDASLDFEWTEELKKTCDNVSIDFFTSPYSYLLVDKMNKYVPAFKIGSGDINWPGIIEKMASYKKPIFLATGASSMDDVTRAVDIIVKNNNMLCLMQCNTNYTASKMNFKYINLNVLKTFRAMYPDIVLGLSDHTLGNTTVLGAVALGARVIEKHFTDSNERTGPDHQFSMTPESWRIMVEKTRELEDSLGGGVKKIEENEKDTVIVQRRAIRVSNSLNRGHILTDDDLVFLRPCPPDGIPPFFKNKIIGKKVEKQLKAGDHIKWVDLN